MKMQKNNFVSWKSVFFSVAVFLFAISYAFGSVEYKVVTDWGSGFQGEITITNTASTPYQNLTIEFDFPYEITSEWDMQKISHQGVNYVFKLPSWKTTLNSGESHSFGFIASPGNATSKPSNIKINGSSTEPGKNTAPKAVDDIVSTNINTSVNIKVLLNDSDPDGDNLFISKVSSPAHGSTQILADSISYFPVTGFVGTDSFTYTIEDGKGASSTATVTVNVKSSTTTSPDVKFQITSDWGTGFNANLLITNNTAAAFTSWTLEFDLPHEITSLWNGKITSHTGTHYIVQDSGWNANVPVKGIVTIGFGAISNGTVFEPYNIKLNGNSVNPDPQKPVASNDTATVAQDKYIDIDVLKNDQGAGLTISKVSNPANGTVVVNNSKITYTPTKGFYGIDSFTYTVKDNLGQEASATVTVTVNKTEAPKAPIANPDTVSTIIDSPITIDILDNDTGTNGSLTIASITQPANGIAKIENSKVIYTPNSGYKGNDSFQYTVKDSLGLTSTGIVTISVGTAPQINKVNATFWSIWGGNTSYNIGGKTITSAPIDMDKIDSSYNCIITAFIVTDANSNFWLAYDFSNPSQQSGTYTPAQVKQFIKNVKAQGRKPIVSVGGEKFNFNMQTEEQKQKFITQIEQIINDYGFEGLDLDFETGATSSNPELMGQAVTKIITDYRSKGIDFWLTAAPEWCYIVPFVYGTGQWASHSLAGDFYVKLINAIGVNNFTYIWPQTYNQGPSNGITGKGGTKVCPGTDGMAKFIAAMVWAASTQEGYEANGKIGIFIPPAKFAIGIPATEGAAGGEMAYIATPSIIAEACNLIKTQGTSFAGFMNWSVDWDAINITDGQLSSGYTHAPWDTGKAIAESLNISSGPSGGDTTSPEVKFTNLTDGQVLKFNALSPINIGMLVNDPEGNLESLVVTVDGQTFDGTTITWTPSAFGYYKITAIAKDIAGNITVLAIGVTIEKSETPVFKNKQIIGYITQWDAWKDTTYQLPVKGIYNQLNVDYSKYTVLNYSFFGVAKDGSLHSADLRNKAMTANSSAVQEPASLLYEDIYSSWDMWLLYGDVQNNWNTEPPTIEKVANGAQGLFDLCKKNNIKLLASIGGWSMCKHFPEMAADPAKKALFLRDCKKLIDMGFDGIDIDWEYPGATGMNFTGTQADFANYAKLMKDIRATIGTGKLLTAAFSCSPALLNSLEWSELDKYMDYFDIMSYDLEGGWSDKTGHNSALYGDSGSLCWDNTFKFLTQQKGVKPEKINMGVAFYGRGVETNGNAYLGAPTLKKEKTFSIDGSLQSAADLSNWGLFEGSPYYTYLKNNTTSWVEHWDEKGKVPYKTKDNYFLSYDNPRSVQCKADYIMQNNAAGVIIWQVFGDMEFSGGYDYCNNSVTKLPKAKTVTTTLLDVLHDTFNN